MLNRLWIYSVVLYPTHQVSNRMINVGLIGCGNIGSFIARYLDKSKKFRLVSVFDEEDSRADALVLGLKNKPRIARNINALLLHTDLIVEAASQEAVRRHSIKILKAGKDLLIMSVGALTDRKILYKIKNVAETGGCLVYLPSGAICGLDGVKSASVGKISSVTLTTTKPLSALRGVEYLDKKINVDKLLKPTVVYSGPAFHAAKLFPKNINVSTILALCGMGLKKTKVIIIADPKARHNTHEIRLEGDCGEIYIKLLNQPSPTNPKTSYLACLSAVKTLEQIECGLKIGT